MHREYVSPSARHADRVFEQGALHGDIALDQLHAHCVGLVGR